MSTGSSAALGARGCWGKALLFVTLSPDTELAPSRWTQPCPVAFGQALVKSSEAQAGARARGPSLRHLKAQHHSQASMMQNMHVSPRSSVLEGHYFLMEHCVSFFQKKPPSATTFHSGQLVGFIFVAFPSQKDTRSPAGQACGSEEEPEGTAPSAATTARDTPPAFTHAQTNAPAPPSRPFRHCKEQPVAHAHSEEAVVRGDESPSPALYRRRSGVSVPLRRRRLSPPPRLLPGRRNPGGAAGGGGRWRLGLAGRRRRRRQQRL